MVTGVVEEKNNRVVELILATVRPRHLLAGKVIGIGLLGFAQLALIAGLAAALLAAGVFDAPADSAATSRSSSPGSRSGSRSTPSPTPPPARSPPASRTPTRPGQPVTYTLIAVYFAGYVALSVNADGPLANLLTVFPLTAPLVLPARSALVGVPLWEHVLAVVLVLGTIYALVRFAGRIYAHGLLHGGRLWRRLASPTSPDAMLIAEELLCSSDDRTGRLVAPSNRWTPRWAARS